MSNGTMSMLAVVKFPDPTGAAALWAELVALQLQGAITLADGVVVVRRPDGTAKMKQVTGRVGPLAHAGALLGLLVGLLVGSPWLGVAAGAGAGALIGRVLDLDLDTPFIDEVSAALQPGESALFVLAREVARDEVFEHLRFFDGEVIHTSLSATEEATLQAAFRRRPHWLD